MQASGVASAGGCRSASGRLSTKTISPEQLGAFVEVDQLGISELSISILVKDLLITDVLGMLAAFEWGEAQPVFFGGTSMSKGYGLIQRMSDVIDFKLVLHQGCLKVIRNSLARA